MLSVSDLNATEQEGLQEILRKNESAWTEDERAHLQARADYLSSDDRARLAAVSGEAEEAPARKGRKASSDEE